MIFRILISISLLTSISGAFSQEINRLMTADSLFKNEKYTEAFEIYEGLYASGQVSPAMLSKMAFIKEGLGDFTSALFYLEKYYQLSGNKQALAKMNEIAESKNLIGYGQSDSAFIIHSIIKYKIQISIGLAAMCLLLLVMIIVKSARGRSRPIALVIVEVMVLAGLWYLSNQSINQRMAITRNSQTIVMEGPSSGSNFVTTMTKGNRIQVIHSDPIWTKVLIAGEEGYIRTNQLLLL